MNASQFPGLQKAGVNYLRVSVTDRCNLRCVYCRPSDDCDFVEHAEVLRFEEIHRIVRLLAECGISRVRLTGGEPLMRRDLTSLVAKLSATERIEDLALTTNGVLLEPMADELKAAGLHRVNIGLSSTQAQNYREVTGFDFLEQVTGGIYKAIEAGLEPVKINAVVLKGLNDCQITELARMSVRLPIIVRFVEYYPTTRHTKPAAEYVPNYTVKHIIEREFGPLSDTIIKYSGGPASYFKISGSAGAIGFIDCRTAVFCHSCNRLRLTSDGRIRPCLYSAFDYDIKRILRSGAADEQVRRLLITIVEEKYQFTRQNSFMEEFCMRKVGG